MKKLMTMLSAVALGFGLNASAAFTDTGTSFEGMDEGPLDTASATGELVPNSSGYWSATNENCAATVTAGTSIVRSDERKISQFEGADQDKYLSIKTSFGNALTRTAKADGTAVDLTDKDFGGSFYIDSLVQFSVFDEDPTFTNSAGTAVYDGAKLAIWLQEVNPDDPSKGTNLYIRAGTVGGEAQTYDCGAFEGPADWHRLTVKAISDIYKSTEGDPIPGFVVFVDMTMKGAVDADMGIVQGNVKDAYLKFASSKCIFPSMASGSKAQTIKALDFDGTGAVDDLVFTAALPFEDADDDKSTYVNLTWDSHVTSLTYSVNDGAPVTLTEAQLKASSLEKFPCASGATVKLVVSGITYAEGYCGETSASATLNAENYSLAITSKSAAAAFAGVGYETAAEAFEAAAAATEPGTIKLFADYRSGAEIEFLNANGTTLDLAGKTIDASLGAYEGGSLIIVDTVGGGKVDGYVGCDGGTVEIQGGMFKVKDAAEGGIDENYDTTIRQFATKGKVFELNADDTYYVLTEQKAAKIGDVKYDTLQLAIDAAIEAASSADESSDSVVVEICSDITLTETLTIDSDDAEKVAFTINTPEGYTVTSAPTNGSDPGVTIDGVTITFTGDGTWQKTSGSKTFICVGETTASANVLVEGGTFTAAASHVMSVMNGIIAVTGGTFETKGTNHWCVRAEMSELESLSSGYGVIVVTGGTFTNPTTAADENGVPIAPVGVKNADSLAAGAAAYIDVNGTAKFAGNEAAIRGTMEDYLVTIETDGDSGDVTYTDVSEDWKFKLVDDYYVATEIEWSAIKVTWDAYVLSWAGKDGEGEDDAESWTKQDGETQTEAVFKYDIDDAPVTFAITNTTFATGYELDSDKSVLSNALPTTANVTNEITIVSKLTQAVTPLDPTDANGTTYDSAEDATKAAEEFNEALKTNPELIEVPSVVTSDDDKKAYRALFQAVADGTTVKLDFTQDAKEDLANAAETAVESIELQAFAASDGSSAQNLLTVKEAIPGLWYTLLTGTDTPANLPTAHSQQAETSEVKFNVTKGADTDRAFFRMKITTTEVRSTGLTN